MAKRKPNRFSGAKGFDYHGKVQIATRINKEDFDLIVMAAQSLDVSVSLAIRSIIANWAQRKGDEVRKMAGAQ